MNTTVLEKIQSELERSGCDAFLLSGGDNMRYAAQVHLPFTDEHPGLAFVLFAKGRLPLVLSPSLWARSWERGIISDVRAYPGSLNATHAAAELAAFLRPLGLASIGLDMNRASVALRDALGEWALTDISAAISAIRQIKSAEEAAFLEDLAYRADHAILGAAHHSLACDARAEKGQAELIRMHALERGFEAVGYNGISQSATGAHAKDYWAESPKFGIGQGKKTARDEMNRLDLQASLNGYWAFGSRLMTMGWPLPEQTKAYEGLVAMRKAALAAVRPGATCADLYAAMLDAAERAGVTPVTGVHWGQHRRRLAGGPVDRTGRCHRAQGRHGAGAEPACAGPRRNHPVLPRHGAVGFQRLQDPRLVQGLARAVRRVRLLLQRRRLIWARLRVSGAAPQGSRSRA